MTQIISDTQAQNNTSSTNGRNIMPKLKAESHFPIQTGSLAQTDSQCFGAQSASSFRTTSKLTFTGNKKVYSICSGQVFLQPTEGIAGKVNLVLKPFKQPIGGLPIKYIIYRGLNKSDFFNSDTEPKVVGDDSTGTDFVQFIWTQFNKFYENDDPTETKPDFLAKFLGYSSSTDSDYKARLIDSFFYKVTEYTDEEMTTEDADTAFELPIIPMGLYLGKATDSIGIDIVLNDGDYYIPNDPNPFQYNITFARSADHSLETSTSNTAYENKLIKESCTKFIDLSAFFGLHASGDGKIHSKDSTETASVATEVDDIYGLISDFYTKNRVYLYIQANRQRSYNFYGEFNYSDTNDNSITLSNNQGSQVETKFGSLDWPIQHMDFINFFNNQFSIQLIAEYDFEEILGFLKIGRFSDSDKIRYIGYHDLVPTGQQSGKGYTSNIEFNNEFINDGSNNKPVSNIISIIYNGNKTFYNPFPVDIDLFKIDDFNVLKEMFILPLKTSFLQPTNELFILPSNIYSIIKYIDSDITYSNDKFVIQHNLVKTVGKKLSDPQDPMSEYIIKDRLIFISQLKQSPELFISNHTINVNEPNKQSDQKDNFFKSVFGSKTFSLNEYIITESNLSFSSFQLTQEEEINSQYFNLGIMQSEYELLISNIPNNANNVSFFLKDFAYDANNDEVLDISYYRFSVGIIYEDEYGTLQSFAPQTSELIVYGTSLNYLTSKEYSEYENYIN
jgi:hypothetical protein